MRIHGTIRNSKTNAPVKNAKIKLSINQGEFFLVLSDEQGRFEHKTEGAGQTLDIIAEKDGFSRISGSYRMNKPEFQIEILIDEIYEKPVPGKRPWYTQVKNLLSTNASLVSSFLIDQISESKKKIGSNKEAEALSSQLMSYKKKTELLETELNKYEEIIKKLESTLGSNYISENAFVNWSLDKIKPETSAFKIEVWVEKGDYQDMRDITTAQKQKTEKTYRIGDKMNLYFMSEKDCYLTILNYGTSGKLTVLFPNAIFKDNFIEGNIIYAIPGKSYPFDYKISGPPGTEKIKAIAATHKFDLIDLTIQKGEFFSTSKSATRDISVVTKKFENKKLDEWAEAMCEIHVI